MNEQPTHFPDLQSLVSLFYSDSDELGQFVEVSAAELPPGPRQLLAHNAHMTEAMEAFHSTPVDVEALQRQNDTGHYTRTSLLRRQSDHGPVQFGIVRLDRRFLRKEVLDEIIGEQTPLGRVLIKYDVMREVQLVALWQIEPGPELRRLLNIADDDSRPIYGRTALIYCNGEPGVELLEIASND